MAFSLSGLSVLTPNALWALLALLLPILIHLFNRSRGRLVPIGHIDLVRQARRLRVTEVKLAQWLLLLLRLAIFTLAALILAGLARPGLDSRSGSTTYVTSEWLKTTSPENIEAVLIEAEEASTNSIFLLQPGFPSLDRSRLDKFGQQMPPTATDFSNVWPLLAERLSVEHHVGEVTVHATDYVLQYGVDRPSLPRDVDWVLTHPESAPVMSSNAIRVVIVTDDNHADEATLLGDTLAVLKQHRLSGLTWSTTGSDTLNEAQPNADWLIFLTESDANLRQLALINSATTVLSFAMGTTENVQQIIKLPFYPFSTFRLNRYTKMDADVESAWKTLLATADGSPLLQESRSGPLRLLHFNSRFNPHWGSITQQAEFPELFLQLMLNEQQQLSRFADARTDLTQLKSDLVKTGMDGPLPSRSLQGLLALLLVLLWITERWLSERRPREQG
jgi:hypothetical protein